MSLVAAIDPDDELLRSLEATAPYSPFNTLAYAEASRNLGATPCVFLHGGDSGDARGCLGLLKGLPAYRRLEIPSAPDLDDPDRFWEEVRRFCVQNRVSELQVDSFASRNPQLPSYPYVLQRTKRIEYLLDLRNDEFSAAFSKNHKRNIKKALAAGVELTRTNREAACIEHVRLMSASMSRRIERGEELDFELETKPFKAVLATGAGELFQARLDEKLLASVLVLRSRLSGYYQTAGTLPEGMAIGASPFLIGEIARELAEDGLHFFNLGGAGPESGGLQRFKQGFGTQAVELEAAMYSMVSAYRRLARKIYGKLRKTLPGLRLNTG